MIGMRRGGYKRRGSGWIGLTEGLETTVGRDETLGVFIREVRGVRGVSGALREAGRVWEGPMGGCGCEV